VTETAILGRVLVNVTGVEFDSGELVEFLLLPDVLALVSGNLSRDMVDNDTAHQTESEHGGHYFEPAHLVD
jgi:hypothetical protein